MFFKALIGLFKKKQTEKLPFPKPKRWVEHKIHYDKSKCTKCHLCVRYCPPNAISITEDKFIKVNHEKCIRCALCTEVCPTKALTIKEK